MSVSTLTREPLLVRTFLTVLVTALVNVAVLRGWVTVEDVSEETVAGVVNVLAALLGALWARQAVTPVADPVLTEVVTTRIADLPPSVAVVHVQDDGVVGPEDFPGHP